jgi:uncharacterized membrane-anchored protein YitT (DUF2179 family)
MTKKHQSDLIQWENVWNLKNLLQIFIGAAMAVFAMKGFMIPNQFMDGGVTGISILLHEITHINISFFIVAFNLPFIYLGYKRIGKTFAIQTTLAMILLSAGLMFSDIKPFTTDPLLIAIFGGILIGTGVGMVIRSGGVLDGAEVIAVFTKRRTGFSNSEIIMLFNTFIFAGAAFHFGLETAMYSLITYYSATRATDYIVDGIEQYTSIHIISAHHDKVKDLLVNELGKGITVYKGQRGYLPGSFNIKEDCEIIVTIVTRLEINNIQESISEIDPKAFMYIQSVKEAAGGILKEKRHAK